jgi:hypothetical protein
MAAKKKTIMALLPIKILSIILEHFGRFFFRNGWVSFCFSYLPLGVLEPCLLWRLGKPDSNLATEIISADGVVWEVFSKKRSQLKYSDLPKICSNLSSHRRRAFLNTQALTERNRAFASLGTSGGASTLHNN